MSRHKTTGQRRLRAVSGSPIPSAGRGGRPASVIGADRQACAGVRPHTPGPAARRRRARLLGLLRLVVLLALVFLVAWAGARVARAADSAALRDGVHVVRQGETLWGIVVDRYGSREHDVRRLVSLVMAANHLPSARLFPGQEICLPPAD